MTSSTLQQTFKRCNHCHEELPLTEFQKNRSTKDGLQKRCKRCMSKANALTKQRKGAKVVDLEQHAAQLKRKYGITPEQYQEMFDKQEGKCAICGTTSCATGRRFAVDHNHQTGEVRGLLCAHCNTAIGKFNDDIELLRKAKSYLESYADF